MTPQLGPVWRWSPWGSLRVHPRVRSVVCPVPRRRGRHTGPRTCSSRWVEVLNTPRPCLPRHMGSGRVKQPPVASPYRPAATHSSVSMLTCILRAITRPRVHLMRTPLVSSRAPRALIILYRVMRVRSALRRQRCAGEPGTLHRTQVSHDPVRVVSTIITRPTPCQRHLVGTVGMDP